MLIDGKSVSPTNYRYSFNTQEISTEINQNHTTAEFWEYDSRSGRRWNLDPIDQIDISNYATFANNPILYNDILGDKVGSTQEGWDIANEGLTATLGANHPFSYDASSGQWQVDNNFDAFNYNSIQYETYSKLSSLVSDKELTVNVNMVNSDDKIQYSLGGNITTSLNKLGGDALTDPNYSDASNSFLIRVEVYVSRNPTVKLPHGEYPSDKPIGLTMLHELGGHSFDFVFNPSMTRSENLLSATQYSNRLRTQYQVPMTGWDRFLNSLNPFSPAIPSNATKAIGGKNIPHNQDEEDKLNSIGE